MFSMTAKVGTGLQFFVFIALSYKECYGKPLNKTTLHQPTNHTVAKKAPSLRA